MIPLQNGLLVSLIALGIAPSLVAVIFIMCSAKSSPSSSNPAAASTKGSTSNPVVGNDVRPHQEIAHNSLELSLDHLGEKNIQLP
jgi:hypothetical protein